MARPTAEQWENLIADFHTGAFSKNELAEKYDLSHTAVNKRLKGIEPKHKDKVSTLISIKSDLAHESFKEVSAVETIVAEKTKHLLLFQNSALKNQKKANELLELTDDMKDLESHARLTKTNKETVLGKEIDTIIKNTNALLTDNTKNEMIVTFK